MIAFVLILASILTGALTAVEALTKPIIARNEERKIKRNVLAALDVPFDEASIERTFGDTVTVTEKNGRRFYRTADKTVAFAIEGSGLWGPIRGILAVRPDGETVKGITIVHQEETPGLGSRIAEASYLDKFRSKRLLPRLTITEEGKASGASQVDGITGATLSCQAFARILNSEVSACLPVVREVQQ
jgi:Na+-transporting NADH:ubiquinone oxidoreductase subunit C